MLSLRNYGTTHSSVDELRFSQLAFGGQLFIWSVRQWAASELKGVEFQAEWHRPFRYYRCEKALEYLQRFMEVLISKQSRTLEIRPIGHAYASPDERSLLRVVQAMDAYRDVLTARKTAAQLVDRDLDGLCQSALYFGNSLRAAGLKLGQYRDLRLVAAA